MANGRELKEAGGEFDDEYLRSSNVYPAFNFGELNNQASNRRDELASDADNLDSLKEERSRIIHHLTTMPTDLKNRLMTGPRLRRAWKKDPFLSYNPSTFNGDSEMPDDQLEDTKRDQLNDDQAVDNPRLAEIEGNLNKEVDLEELTKYLMAKRNELESKKAKNSDSNSSSSKSSGSEADDSKQSSKDSSKESNETSTSEMTKEETLLPSNYTTELKKTIITEQDGKAIKKVETYKKSVELSEHRSPDDYRTLLEDQSNLLLVNQPSDANYERMLHQVNVEGPIQVRQRNSMDKYDGHLLQKSRFFTFSDLYFIGIVIACSMVSILSVIGAGYCFYSRFQQHSKATANVDYPAYGVIGPAFKSSQDDDVSPKTKTNPHVQESLVSKATNINHQSILSPEGNQHGSDRKLAQSAQMYHYHHQKQQMISTEK